MHSQVKIKEMSAMDDDEDGPPPLIPFVAEPFDDDEVPPLVRYDEENDVLYDHLGEIVEFNRRHNAVGGHVRVAIYDDAGLERRRIYYAAIEE